MSKSITAAGGLVENEKGELLLIFRKGHWDLPKGKIDEGETIEACALREVEEETGLSNVQLGKFIDTTTHEYEENGEHITKTTHWYRMKGSSADTLTPQTEEQIHDIKWIAKEAIQGYLKDSYQNIQDIVSIAIR